MKAIVILADRSRHEVDLDQETLARGKFVFSPEMNVPASPWPPPPLPEFITAHHCYRIGSDDGVPVFVER